ncbi:unnamed protein product [Mycena citricolor]|uniref:Uncharacterized protein n=1 Tax=Mycena citricolor TaxID=2018698 RepID=A0AAD2K516_9AGAR|nr:unnamed protein product [Mycena citricolor]
MSMLPATRKSISSPAAGSPSDSPHPDIDGKIRFYGALSALRQSYLPTNAQVTDVLAYVKTHSPVEEKKLSAEGRRLVGDMRRIIDTLSAIVREKNDGEVLQRFVWATRAVDATALKPSEAEQAKVKDEVDKARLDAQEAAHHLRALIALVLTNGEMRKLVTDLGTLGRDLIAHGAAKVAKAVSPRVDALSQVDDIAPHDTFGDSSLLSPSRSVVTAPSFSSVHSLASSASESTSGCDPGLTEPTPSPTHKKRFVDRLVSLNAPKPTEILEDGRTWFSDEFFPEERRERWVWRGKKVIVECQKHDDYRASMTWLLNTVVAWAGRCGGLIPQTELKQDVSLQSALDLFRLLLERFAGASLEPILSAARVLAHDAAEDESLRSWWSAVGAFARKVLLQVGYVTEDACAARARELRDLGRAFYREKYRSHFEALIDSIASWFRSFAEEPLNKELAESFTKLTRDLLFDREGNLQFKKKLWEDVRGIILPTLVDKVGFVPIPRVEYTDDNVDLVVENLTLSGRHLFPNVIELEAHNLVRFSPYTQGNLSRHEVTVKFSEIQAAMRDVAFSFRTKTGIKMRDSGMADVVLGGRGLSVLITLASSASKDTSSIFRVTRVRVKVASLKLSIRDTKHDMLYKTFKPLATRLIKKQIQKAFEEAIRTGLEYLDGQLVSARNKMADDGVEEVGQKSLKSEHLPEASTLTTSLSMSTTASGGSQFKVVASKKRSILPNSGHPAGWVNRVAERQQQIAEQGDEWRSDAFDVQPLGRAKNLQVPKASLA